MKSKLTSPLFFAPRCSAARFPARLCLCVLLCVGALQAQSVPARQVRKKAVQAGAPGTAQASTPAAIPAPTTPAAAAATDQPTDAQRLDIARAQRDYWIADEKVKDAVAHFNAAKAEVDAMEKALAEKIAAANKFCGEKRTFNASQLVCVVATTDDGKAK
jgi:hypothetical protein